MALSPDQLKQTLKDAARPLGVKELVRLAGLNPGVQTDVKRVLRDLLKSGSVEKDGKRFFVPGARKPKAPLPEEASSHAQAPRRPPAAVRSGRGQPRNVGSPASGATKHAKDAPKRSSRAAAPPERRRHGGTERKGSRGTGRQIEGRLSVHRDGFGFVKVPEGDDIYLPASEARHALDGDRVRIEVVGGHGSTEGKFLEVTGRLRQQVVGTYVAKDPRKTHVVPNDRSLPGIIRVPPTQLARDGDVVKVTLGVGGDLTGTDGLFGEISGSLGKPGQPSQEVLSVAYAQGFSDEFPAAVMAAADAVGLKVTEAEAHETGRRDLRKLPLVTIDGADARDFDDAVHAQALGHGGFRLWVAIADVTHYVREGTPLDAEAYQRATSVYLPDRVLPMLPERLSNGICSLKPEEDRLCLVAQMDFDASAQMGAFDVYPGVMRSVARCTYDEVQDVLDGKEVPHRSAFKPHFELLMDLSRKLRAMRAQRGAIDFDLPESKVVVDEEGVPLRLERRERKDSHRLVEECMLAANEAVAKYFLDRELPSVFRFHGTPDEDKLAAFATLARAYGFSIAADKDLSSKDLNGFVKKLEGHPEQKALNQLLLRSMMQAVYSSENVGHYGLAAEQYLHFTSPIRRYPDLLVHRLLKSHWERGEKIPSAHEREGLTERLEEMAVQSSERERAAMTVEREVSSYYATLLMQDRVGESFAAVVSSLVDFGFFVELEAEHIEGLVKLETLGQGGRFDTAIYALVYPTGRNIRVGQKLTVRLVSANLARRQIDFEVVQFDGEVAIDPAARVARSSERPPARSQSRGGPRGQTARPTAAPVHRAPPSAPVEVANAESPHPGFDRLRALASRPRAAEAPERGFTRQVGPRSKGSPRTLKPGGKPGPKSSGSGGRPKKRH